MSQFKRNNNELLKEQCLEYLGGKICAVCGDRTLQIQCYDFHHYKGGKDSNISKLISQNKAFTEEIKKELDKCIVLCSNCHRSLHNGGISNEILRSLHQ